MSGFSDMMMEDGYSDEMDYMDSLETEYLESCNDYDCQSDDDYCSEEDFIEDEDDMLL